MKMKLFLCITYFFGAALAMENPSSENVSAKGTRQEQRIAAKPELNELLSAAKQLNEGKVRGLLEQGLSIDRERGAETLTNFLCHFPFEPGPEVEPKINSMLLLLVLAGVDVKAEREDGLTPLATASFYGLETAVDLFLKEGATPNPKNIVGEYNVPLLNVAKALDRVKYGVTNPERKAAYRRILTSLVRHGADTSISRCGMTIRDCIDRSFTLSPEEKIEWKGLIDKHSTGSNLSVRGTQVII